MSKRCLSIEWNNYAVRNVSIEQFNDWEKINNTFEDLDKIPCQKHDKIFFGAINKTRIIIGAYAFCDVLYMNSSIKNMIYFPKYNTNYSVYWYNYHNGLFGFTDQYNNSLIWNLSNINNEIYVIYYKMLNNCMLLNIYQIAFNI